VPWRLVVKSSKIGPQFWAPNFCGWKFQKVLRQFITVVYPRPCGKVWLSSVVWSGCPAMKKKRIMYGGWVKCRSSLSRFWTKVHDILRRCRRPHVVVNALIRLSIAYYVSFRRYRPLTLPLSCEVEKGGFGAPNCRGMGYRRFRTCIFKSHALPSMWPGLVEFQRLFYSPLV